MKEDIGSIRTGIQGESGGEGAAAGERGVGSRCAGSWHRSENTGALARGRAGQARPARGDGHHGGHERSRRERVVPRARRVSGRAGQVARVAPPRWPRPKGRAPARRPHGKTASASRNSNATCCARTGRLPRPQPCWCCPKKVAVIFNKGEDECSASKIAARLPETSPNSTDPKVLIRTAFRRTPSNCRAPHLRCFELLRRTCGSWEVPTAPHIGQEPCFLWVPYQ
jgi:hypothetical protein